MQRWIGGLMLCMVGWLLWVANSATSLACAALGAAVVLVMQVRAVRRHFTVGLLAAGLVVGLLQITVNLKDSVITGLGRDSTLTGRTELWDTLKTMEPNPLFGAGFESFWLGDRVEKLWSIYWWKPNQAHNGYYETYLNLGLIGVALLLAMMVSAYRKSRLAMQPTHLEDPTRAAPSEMAAFRLAFVLAISLINFTEATFKATHLSFFAFFLVALEYGAGRPVPARLILMPRLRSRGDREARLPSPRATSTLREGRRFELP